MISFWRIFSLEAKALVRSKTLLMLAVASVGWLFVLPRFLKGDGTLDGARELYVRYGLGGAFLLIALALLSSATASLAKERAAKRLQLTMVRPVSAFAIVLAKTLAHALSGAAILLLVALVLCTRVDCRRPSNHVLEPILPSPRAEAEAMYAHFMADERTPEEVKQAPKSLVVRILATRAYDRYESIATNAVARWKFPISDFRASASPSVRLRFTTQIGASDDVKGSLALGDFGATVGNVTKSVIVVPLAGAGNLGETLEFTNCGEKSLMFRPRRDVQLLMPAESFAVNFVFAYLELVAILFALLAFGAMLSAALSRPVALFSAIVVLVVGEMGPSVVEQYPDEFHASKIDRAGLAIARATTALTRPVAGLKPVAALAADERVETDEVVRALVADGVGLPLVFALLAAFALPRKEE